METLPGTTLRISVCRQYSYTCFGLPLVCSVPGCLNSISASKWSPCRGWAPFARVRRQSFGVERQAETVK